VRVRLGRSGIEAFRTARPGTTSQPGAGPSDSSALVAQRPSHGARDYFTARTSDGTLWLLFRRAVQCALAGWLD